MVRGWIYYSISIPLVWENGANDSSVHSEEHMEVENHPVRKRMEILEHKVFATTFHLFIDVPNRPQKRLCRVVHSS